MNLLSLILIAMGIIVAGCVFYVAWQLSSGEFENNRATALADREEHLSNEGDANRAKIEPGEPKES